MPSTCVAQDEKLIKINVFTDSSPLVLAFMTFLESRGPPLLQKRGLELFLGTVSKLAFCPSWKRRLWVSTEMMEFGS